MGCIWFVHFRTTTTNSHSTNSLMVRRKTRRLFKHWRFTMGLMRRLDSILMCLVILTRNDAQWIICMLCIEKAHMDVSLMMDALSEMKGCSEICSCFSLCSILFNFSRFRFQCFRKSVFLWCALLSKISIKECNIIKHFLWR